jgi:transketolase
MATQRQLANCIRILSMDAVQKANSGHPGMPMGMADIAQVLWQDFLQHDPTDPKWVNRDRFVLSNGHGCMLLYALLHLSGYDLPLSEIQNFRKLHSKTPGHPEYGDTPGVETTTGPLGQGLANAVGMAIAEKHLAAQFNRPNFPIINHYTYAFVGDGCLMEGISHEVCSLAGTLVLNKLIVIYDDNQISIDGNVQGWFTDNTPLRFESYGWNVIAAVDGHDSKAIHAAIKTAQHSDKPTLICCKTVIGFGSPNKAGTAKTHGEALGIAEVAAARVELDWPYPAFEIPAEFEAAWDAKAQGQERNAQWQKLFASYAQSHPALAAEFTRRQQKALPADWQATVDALLAELQEAKATIATRKASQMCINHFAQVLPELVGGSADLTGSNLTNWQGVTSFSATNPAGQYIYYGVREFGMSAIMNGLALYGAIIPFGGTFLTFSDYARNALRLAALMRQKVIFVYTHDSIGLGEDGPTHQAIEHAPSLRLIPNLSLWRPCDTVETAIAWQHAIEYNGPTCLLFSRQNLPFQQRTAEACANITKGGYILIPTNGLPDLILIATGSEVELAVAAAAELAKTNWRVQVVSMPSVDKFLAQDEAYQQTVLPASVQARIVIEAAATAGWYRFVGNRGLVIGLDRFGVSAPAQDAFNECGLTVAHIVAEANTLLC